MFTPPYTHPLNLKATLKQQGFALLPAADVAALSGCTLNDLLALNESWNRLGADNYLKDGGKYRSRRHGSCVVSSAGVKSVAHRAHWQPVEYNALHGGLNRWFEPVQSDVSAADSWRALIASIGNACAKAAQQSADWFIEAHQFRIDTTDGIGRPTPEGAHRDGVDWVAVILIARHQIKGGETRVFDANGPSGQRFTLTEPWSVLLLNDRRMIHESTPIQPLNADGGYRDTLVLTYRRDGFQGPDA